MGSMNLEAEQDLARGVGRLPGSRASEPSRHTSKRLPSPRNAPSQDVRVHGNIPPKNRALPRLDAAARCPERPERQTDPQDAVYDGYDRRRLPKRAHKAVKRHEQHHA